jgi:hypothetical protein
VRIDVSWAARRWIKRHGGRIYIWATTVAPAYDRLHTSTSQPGDGDFSAHETIGDVEVCVENFLAGQDTLVRVERRVVPPWGVAASSGVKAGGWGTGP